MTWRGRSSVFGLLTLIALAAVVLCFSLFGLENPPVTWTWNRQVRLSPSPLLFRWNTLDDPIWITMELSAPSPPPGLRYRYLGVGWSPTGGMTGADMAIGWFDDGVERHESSHHHLKDYHGLENGVPIQDSQQDFVLLEASQDEVNWTRFVFKRKRDTCDEVGDMVLGEDTTKLIWAYAYTAAHTVDDERGAVPVDSTSFWHGTGAHRGTRSIFMGSAGKQLRFPDDDDESEVKVWDIAEEQLTVPVVATYYHCRIFKFPPIETKHHIIGFRPLISPVEHTPYVHHMRVSKCNVPEGGSDDDDRDVMAKFMTDEFKSRSDGVECLAAPLEWAQYCNDVDTVTYAKGSEGEMFPSHVGVEIPATTSSSSYYRLQVHYENADGVASSVPDSSGIRIYYTSRLRENAAGLLTVGHRRTPFLTIPPGQNSFRIAGHCTSECTSAGLPRSGVKVISVFLHAHLRARTVSMRLIRDGVELEPLAVDRHYDFNYQVYRSVDPKERLLLPGDEIRVECEYETRHNATMVVGGLSSSEEMCHGFMYVYPKPRLVDCRSQPEYGSYLAALGLKERDVNGSLLSTLSLPYKPARSRSHTAKYLPPDDANLLGIRDATVFKELLININANETNKVSLYDYMNMSSSRGGRHGQLDWSNASLVAHVESVWANGPSYAYCGAASGLSLQIQHIVQPLKYKAYVEKQRECRRGA